MACLPSLLLFGSHTEITQSETLQALRSALTSDPRLAALRAAITGLPQFWQRAISSCPKLNSVDGEASCASLVKWLAEGYPLRFSHTDDHNHLTLPLTFLLQISQYAAYVKHTGLRTHEKVLQSVRHGGIHGFCVGFLTALTVSLAQTGEDIGAVAAAAFRVSVLIGAYADVDSIRTGPYACVAIRWSSQTDAPRQQLDHVLSSFSGAYVSSVNDSNSVTVTAIATDISAIKNDIGAVGWRSANVDVRARFHSRFHSKSAHEISSFIRRHENMFSALAGPLRAPLRSSVDGQRIGSGSLDSMIHHILDNALLKRVDWYNTVQDSVNLLPDDRKRVACFGLGQHLPPSLTHRKALKVSISEEQIGHGIFKFAVPVGRSTPPNVEESEYPEHSIAIVGMAGRFPGADSVDELWEILSQGRVMVEPAPAQIFGLPQTGEYAAKKWWGNFLNDREAFDHRFFKKSSREAAAWDPQQRILLEVTYEALESAGYFRPSSETEPDDYGCYIGAVMNNYYDNMSCHAPTAFATLGTSRCFLSGCMSHHFGWTGPSLMIDTACSSSLVAINTACRAIWSGECSRAIAGGTNVICSPFDYQNLSAAGFLSPSGQCKPFDAAADGYCRGEGVGVVVLKMLKDAERDNDNILGVIIGSAANQNQNLSHITVPHSASQVELYRKVMRLGNVCPEEVSYVEAHGTGTGVGDPIEVRSIRDAFGGPQRNTILHFGSIKGSIGHTESTAGVAGLIKVLLMMRHGEIPAQASHHTLNPKIPAFDKHQMAIPTKSLSWDSRRRVACVNSYGAAGSNSAVIVRESPDRPKKAPTSRFSSYPITISAASNTSLSLYCLKLLSWLNQAETASGIEVPSLAFSLSDRGNPALSQGLALSVSSIQDFKEKLRVFRQGMIFDKSKTPKPIVLVFGGQESTFVGLCPQVYQSYEIFRRHLDECNRLFEMNGINSIFPAVFQNDTIAQVEVLHAALFAVQYASARSWLDCGLKVEAVVGHSFGQLTALCISGVLSLPDAVSLVVGRASLVKEHWGPEAGSMLFLKADRQTVENAIVSLKAKDEVHYAEIACYNGPRSHVVVGSNFSIETLRKLVEGKIQTHVLRVTHGFHSAFTDMILPYLEEMANGLDWNTPKIAIELCDEFKSGSTIGSKVASRHLRQPVFFQHAINRLHDRLGEITWLEAGRGSSVMNLIKNSGITVQQDALLSSKLTPGNVDGELVEMTVNLWRAGHVVQYWAFHRAQAHDYTNLHLPPYQFEKTRHWLGFTARGAKLEDSDPETTTREVHQLIKLTHSDESTGQSIFEVDPGSVRFQSMVGGHVMAGEALAPASLYFEVISRAAFLLQGDTTAERYVPVVEDLTMKSPIGPGTENHINLILTRTEKAISAWSFQITLQPKLGLDSSPQEVSSGHVSLKKRDDTQAMREFKRFESLTRRKPRELRETLDAETMQGKHVYRAFDTVVHYGEHFRGIKRVSCVDNEASATVRITPGIDDPPEQRLCDTPMTDSFMQVAGFLVNYFNNPCIDDVYVCGKIELIQMGGGFTPDTGEWEVYATMDTNDEGRVNTDVYIFDSESGKMVMAGFGFHFYKMVRAVLGRILKHANQSPASNQTAGDDNAATSIKDLVRRKDPATNTISEPNGSQSGTRIRAQLFQLISAATDVPLETISDESTMDNLGIDSLMATEILNDLRVILDLRIDLNTFLFFPTMGALVSHATKNIRKSMPAEESGERRTREPTEQPVQVSESARTARQAISTKSSRRMDLFQIIHEVTDAPRHELGDDTTLGAVGIDSLTATEILNDIRAKFGLKLDLTTLLLSHDLGALVAVIDRALEVEVITTWSQSTNSVHELTPPPEPADSLLPPNEKIVDVPTISSASSAFQDIRLTYDDVGRPIETLRFWEDAYPHQSRLVLAYVLEAFAELGCDLGDIQPGEELPAIFVIDRHEKLMRQLHRVLEDGKLIQPNDAGFVRTALEIDPATADSIYHQTIDLYPPHASVLRLLKSVGSQLAACLTGKKDALQLVFGDKETKQTLEELYEFWPLLRTPTLLLGDFLVKACTNATGSGKFRILEVGAGTGGTTRYIVNRLRNYEIPFEYVFTDVSPSLVAAARKSFKNADDMSFEVLDIETPPTQEYMASFSCIIATNCIHATKDLDVSLLHLRQMLRDDGVLALVEITRNMFWLDIVVGLFEGWWRFEDGRSHALIDETQWEARMKRAGFPEISWTDGASPESKTVRLIGAFPTQSTQQSRQGLQIGLETVVYKTINGQDIHADVYYPKDGPSSPEKLPIALMIHGGSHIIFSRKDVRPAQTRLLLENGFLPVSLDYRMCPEVSLSEGPMVDVCDALDWARHVLPRHKLKQAGCHGDGERVVAVGWSSGGQLAMSLAYTAPARGLRPPEAILAFYCPTDYEDPWWTNPIQPIGAEDTGYTYDVREGVQDSPITNYGVIGAWEPLSDPRIISDRRCRIVLHINWKAQTLPVIIGGYLSRCRTKLFDSAAIQDWNALPQPPIELIRTVSALHQIRQGNYHVPTFLVHGTADDLIPWQQTQAAYDALLNNNVPAGLELVDGAPHICDLSSHPESLGWQAALRGYDFLFSHV